MSNNIYVRIEKSNYDSDFFHKGKTPNSKRNIRTKLKNKAKRTLEKMFASDDFE